LVGIFRPISAPPLEDDAGLLDHLVAALDLRAGAEPSAAASDVASRRELVAVRPG